MFDDRKKEVNVLSLRIKELQEQLSEAESAAMLSRIVTQQMQANGEIEIEEELPNRAPLFSKMLDKNG